MIELNRGITCPDFMKICYIIERCKMEKKKAIRIQSDFVENQKRVEQDSRGRPLFEDTFYYGYSGSDGNYIGQSSTSPNKLLPWGKRENGFVRGVGLSDLY